MTHLTVNKPESQPLSKLERTNERYIFVPKVDIFEQGTDVILVADMPGVSEQTVDITLEKNILTINGRVDDQAVANHSLAYREYRVGDYHRTFALSDEVDRNNIEALIKNGVLHLRLPKAPEAQTKKISVKSSL